MIVRGWRSPATFDFLLHSTNLPDHRALRSARFFILFNCQHLDLDSICFISISPARFRDRSTRYIAAAVLSAPGGGGREHCPLGIALCSFPRSTPPSTSPLAPLSQRRTAISSQSACTWGPGAKVHGLSGQLGQISHGWSLEIVQPRPV